MTSEFFTDSYNEGYTRGKRVLGAICEKMQIEGKSTSEILRILAEIVEPVDSMNQEEVRQYLTDLEKKWLGI